MYIFQGALLCLIYIVLSIVEKLNWYIIKYIFNPKIEKKMSNRGLEGDKHIKNNRKMAEKSYLINNYIKVNGLKTQNKNQFHKMNKNNMANCVLSTRDIL